MFKFKLLKTFKRETETEHSHVEATYPDLTEEETAADCEELKQLFSSLDVDQQAVYLKLFTATIGAFTHLATERADEVDMGCMWKMMNEDGVIYMHKIVTDATQVYDVSELDNAALGKYVYQVYAIEIKQGIGKLAVSVQTGEGITESFNVTKPEKLGYLVQMAIGRLSK